MDAEASGPGTNEAGSPAPEFRQHPRWFVFFAGLAGLMVLAIPVFLRDPEYRAAFFFSINPLTSLKFVVVTPFVVLGWTIFIPVAARMWRSAWSFVFTRDRLIATHQFGRRRLEIPWGAVAAVTKLPPLPFLGSSPRQFSCIALADGTELLFNPHLDRYSEFVDELRQRVSCRVFNPYPAFISR